MLRWGVDVSKYETCILFDILPKPTFKMTASFASIVRTTASSSKFAY